MKEGDPNEDKVFQREFLDYTQNSDAQFQAMQQTIIQLWVWSVLFHSIPDANFRKQKIENDDPESEDSDDNSSKKSREEKVSARRKSFKREANREENKNNGFQQVIIEPPSFTLMLKGASKRRGECRRMIVV